MPPITRPQGIQIGQIGAVQRITPRGEEAGLGSILKQAAAMQFGAEQTRVGTASNTRELGAANTAAGIELMKPFKRIKDSRETLIAEDYAIMAQKELRGAVAELQSSGASPDTWGEAYNTAFAKVQNKAMLAAQKISPAAMEHVYKKLQAEDINLFTEVTKDALKSNLSDQVGMLERKEDWELKEASAARDPAKREAHVKSYMDTLDKASFNGAITPAVAEQKRVSFYKQLRKNTTIQHAIEKGLPATLTMIAAIPDIDDVEKASLRDIAEHEVRFKVKETAALEKTAEQRLRVEQSAQYTVAKNKVMQETNSANLLALLHKIPDYQLSGALDREEGKQLQDDINTRLTQLEKPNPEQDVEDIVRDIEYRIISSPGSVPDKYIMEVRGLSVPTRTRLVALQHDRSSAGGYKDMPVYTDSIKLLNSLDNTKVQVFTFPVDPKTTGATGKGSSISELVSRAVMAYNNEIETRATKLGRRLTSTEIHELDGYVETLVKQVKNAQYPTGGKSVDQLLK